MYDPIFAKSFSQNERKKFGYFALLLCLVIALSICITFKPQLHPLSKIGEAMNLRLSINGAQDMLLNIETNKQNNLKPLDNDAADVKRPVEKMHAVTDMNVSSTQFAVETKKLELICNILEPMSDFCEMEGDIRVQANSSVIFYVVPRTRMFPRNHSWRIQPYARKKPGGTMDFVKHWMVKLVGDHDGIPKCTQNHTTRTVLFSIGGYSGNHFHDFADILIPLYTTTQQFQGSVQFLATDFKPWWPGKFRALLSNLTRHEIINLDGENEVHCYPKMIAGLKSYKELRIDPSKSPNGLSINNFRELLRRTYSLTKSKAINLKMHGDQRPRLLIISRARTRLITNEDKISQMARKLGYEVVKAEVGPFTNLTSFAQIVNSCDVLMGLHGAGLTNMVFLPDNAVLIQIMPLGRVEGFARKEFGESAPDMNTRYLDYVLEKKESSLSQQYGVDPPIVKDPISFHRHDWSVLKSTYLDRQNVTIDLSRFEGALRKALWMLHH